MINLKHLELKVRLSGSQSLLPYTTCIKACPFLSTFRIKYFLQWPFTLHQSLIGVHPYHTRRSEANRYAHQHLEVVELIGFHGCANELNLATRLLQIAVNLKRMVYSFILKNKKKIARPGSLLQGFEKLYLQQLSWWFAESWGTFSVTNLGTKNICYINNADTLEVYCRQLCYVLITI
ncbi:uncharacterized protein [Coffea arabica]|uniref:FBD domain-containing protein n=1 Tax=Coffea arabica TaxID=13443 RepID=A0ABM4U834_COFAR|nr:uncharacterized protein LOC113741516 [Coffea arabica]